MRNFNSNHYAWDSSDCDSCGRLLINILKEVNLMALNNGLPARLTASGTPIDYTINYT